MKPHACNVRKHQRWRAKSGQNKSTKHKIIMEVWRKLRIHLHGLSPTQLSWNWSCLKEQEKRNSLVLLLVQRVAPALWSRNDDSCLSCVYTCIKAETCVAFLSQTPPQGPLDKYIWFNLELGYSFQSDPNYNHRKIQKQKFKVCIPHEVLFSSFASKKVTLSRVWLCIMTQMIKH